MICEKFVKAAETVEGACDISEEITLTSPVRVLGKITDIDGNGIDDILTIKYATAAGSAEYTASYLSYEESAFVDLIIHKVFVGKV